MKDEVVPLAGSRLKLQAGIDDPLGLAKGGGEMLAKLLGSSATFHLRSGLALPCKIVGVSRYEVLVVGDDGKRLLLMKHACDYVEVSRG